MRSSRIVGLQHREQGEYDFHDLSINISPRGTMALNYRLHFETDLSPDELVDLIAGTMAVAREPLVDGVALQFNDVERYATVGMETTWEKSIQSSSLLPSLTGPTGSRVLRRYAIRVEIG